MSGLSFLSDDELVNRLEALDLTDELRGIYLSDLLFGLPLTDPEWHDLGLPSWTSNAYNAAALLIVSAVGTGEQIATSFVTELRSRPERGLLNLPTLRRDCVIRSWNNRQYDPEAIATLAEYFVDNTEVLRLILNNKYVGLPKPSIGIFRPHPLIKFNQTLTAMKKRSLPDGSHEIIDFAQIQLEKLVAAQDQMERLAAAKKRQAGVVDAAKIVAYHCRQERSLEFFEKFTSLVAEIAKFDADNATTVLLEGLNSIAAGYRDTLSIMADRNIDTALERLAVQRSITKINLSPQVLSQVNQIEIRRLSRCIKVYNDDVVIDEERLDELERSCRQMGIDFNSTLARREITQTIIPAEQKALDARRLLPVTAEDFPPEILAISISFSDEEPPVVEFTVAPPDQELKVWANTPVSAYQLDRHRMTYNPLGEQHIEKEGQYVELRAQSSTTVDVRRLTDFLGRTMGISGIGAVVDFNPQQAQKITEVIYNSDQGGTISIDTQDGDRSVTIRTHEPATQTMSPTVKEHGKLTFPVPLTWSIPVRPIDYSRVDLRIDAVKVSVQISIPDQSPAKATRYAQALKLVFDHDRASQDPRLGANPAWNFHHLSDLTVLQLPFNRTPQAVAEQVQRIIETGPQPFRRRSSVGRPLPVIDPRGPAGNVSPPYLG